MMVKVIAGICLIILGFFAVQGWHRWYIERQRTQCVASQPYGDKLQYEVTKARCAIQYR